MFVILALPPSEVNPFCYFSVQNYVNKTYLFAAFDDVCLGYCSHSGLETAFPNLSHHQPFISVAFPPIESITLDTIPQYTLKNKGASKGSSSDAIRTISGSTKNHSVKGSLMNILFLKFL